MATKIVAAGAIVRMDAIKKPEGLAELLKEPRIKKLAASIKAVDQIAPAVVERVSQGIFRLWCGKDRYAATTLARLPTIRADIREGTEGDFLLLQEAENAERRGGGNTAELVEKIASSGDGDGALSPSRARAAAVKDVAALRGIQPKSVNRKIQREKEKAERPTQHSKPFGKGRRREPEQSPEFVPPKEIDTTLPMGFDTRGVELASKRQKAIRDTWDLLWRWKAKLTELTDEIDVYSNGGLSDVVWVENLKGIISASKSMELAIENAKPAAICRTCKDENSEKCERCHGTGVVGRFGNEQLTSEAERAAGGE
jgi:hypothetical protein